MKVAAASKDRIVDAAADVIALHGIASLTIARIADRCGVSSALVHYHFSTKDKLLRAAAGRLATARTEVRQASVRAPGIAALDGLWQQIEESVAKRTEQAWHDVLLLAREDRAVAVEVERTRDAEWRALARRLPGLFTELGSTPPASEEEIALAILVFADGIALGMAAGAPRDALKSAYGAFWLALIAAGQSGARR